MGMTPWSEDAAPSAAAWASFHHFVCSTRLIVKIPRGLRLPQPWPPPSGGVSTGPRVTFLGESGLTSVLFLGGDGQSGLASVLPASCLNCYPLVWVSASGFVAGSSLGSRPAVVWVPHTVTPTYWSVWRGCLAPLGPRYLVLLQSPLLTTSCCGQCRCSS